MSDDAAPPIDEVELELRRRQQEGREAKRAQRAAEVVSDAVPAPAVVEGEVLPPAPWKSDGRFVKGDPRISRGRHPQSKNRIGNAFVLDLMKWHAKHGIKAIEKVGREQPVELLRIIASFIPKKLEVEHEHEHSGTVVIRPVDVRQIDQRIQELFAGIADREVEGSGSG
jgi:hypothetical protein